jgi:hypothetical protein
LTLLSRILPARVDNRYRGHPLGLWLYLPIAAQKVALSLTHLFKADGGAQSISTIPLDTYPASAAQNVVALFARVGLEQLVLGVILLLVALRYRAMIPLMYIVVVGEFLASKLVAQAKPLALAGQSGASTPLLVIAAVSAVGLVLSLIGRGYADERD